MNPRSTRLLAIVAAVLIAGVLLMNVTNDSHAPEGGGLLLPDLKAQINAIDTVSIAAGEASATIAQRDGRWVVASRDGYPADTGKLREALLALADAGKLEQKTSNPERYEQLGLAGEAATRVELSGDDVDVAVILGNSAQRSYRYAMLDGAAETWLIDTDPELPADGTEWLLADLLDIKADAVVSVEIAHADGETIRLSRGEDGRLGVDNLPAGRELTYATVVNPIAGALAALQLEDVRAPAAEPGSPDVTARFRTSDGLLVTAHRFDGEADDAEAWFALAAEAPEPAGESADEPVAAEQDADADPVDEADAPAAPSAAERAADINATVEGWLYRLPTYKADQLAKRWDDLLAPLDDGSADE